jgi:outer membrane protein TolC
MAKRIPFLFFSSLLFICCAGSPAFGFENKYSYPSIREEYADTVCRLDGMASPDTGTGGAVCVLDKPISLNDAIGIALKNNPDNQMAVARIDQARALIEKADSAFYPTLGFYSEYMQGNSPSAYLFKTIDQRKLSPGVDFNDPGWFENYETGVMGSFNLYNGGRDLLNRKMAETGLNINQQDRRAIENSLIASVIIAYYDYMAAKDFIEIAEESAVTVGTELEIMQVRMRAGGALKSDVLSLEVRLAQAREEVVRSQNQLKMTMAALANLLGVSPDRELIIKTSEPKPIKIPENYKGGVAHALEKRPELKKVREQLRQSRMALDMSGSEYLPSIDLQGKYYHDDPDMSYDGSRENWTVAIVLNWYFFTGFSTRAELKNASAKIEEILAADRKTVLSVQLDVKNAYLRLAEARARLEVAEKSVASAEESLELVKKQYEGGSATITRYLEAELARNTAKIRVTRAFYDREQAVADVGRAIGALGIIFTQDEDG